MWLISEFIGEQISLGQRGFIFGESHEDVEIIKSFAAEFKDIRKQGVSTIYVEYIPAEKQRLLSNALNGDEKSQKELRAMFEASWAYSHEAAQERYNAIFAAHKYGMRVVAVDTAYSQSAASHEHLWGTTSDQVSAGAHISRHIQDNDDGKAFIVLVGKAQKYAANVPDQSSPFDTGRLKRNSFGGLKARLSAQGIAVVSIGIEAIAGMPKTPFLTEGNAINPQFVLRATADNKNELTMDNLALTKLGGLVRLHTKLEHMVATGHETTAANLLLATEAEQVARRIIDRLLIGKTFQSQDEDIAYLKGIVYPLVSQLRDKNEALYVRRMLQNLRDVLDNDDVRDLIKDGEAALKGRAAKHIWNPYARTETADYEGRDQDELIYA